MGTPIGSWEYLCTQFGAIVHYLRLCVWPHPLVFDYGTGTAQGPMEIVPYAIDRGAAGGGDGRGAVAVAESRISGGVVLCDSGADVERGAGGHADHRRASHVSAAGGGGGGRSDRRVGRRPPDCPQRDRLAGDGPGGGRFARDVHMHRAGNPHFSAKRRLPRRVRHLERHGEVLTGKRTGAEQPGRSLTERGQFDEALNCYRKALESEPNYADAHSNLGGTLTKLGRFDEALAECRKALEIDPNYTDARNNLGMTLSECGRADEAIPLFREVLAIKPDSVSAQYNLGLALIRQKQFQEAVAPLRKALALKADFAEAHINLGVALANCGQLDEAVSEYRKALAIQPDNAAARDNLGIVETQRKESVNVAGHAACIARLAAQQRRLAE